MQPDPSTAATAKDIDPPDVNRLCTTTWVLKGYRADRADQGRIRGGSGALGRGADNNTGDIK